MRASTIIIAILVVAAVSISAAGDIKPQLGEPLRDPSICIGPDKVYYLTGTTLAPNADGLPDSNDCRGVAVWTSRDLQSWEKLGMVCDLWQDFPIVSPGKSIARWYGELYPVPGLPSGRRSRGLTTPRLLFQDNRFWISFSMSGYGAGLFSSEGADIKGPYLPTPQMAEAGASPSAMSDAMIFADQDGSRYLVWGGGVIAKLDSRENLIRKSYDDPGAVGVVGKSEFIPTFMDGYFTDRQLPQQGAPYGAFLFFCGERYHFLYTATTFRNGAAHEDSYISSADALLGSYSRPRLFIPDSGRVTAFKDLSGNWQAVFSPTGGDSPVIARIEKDFTKVSGIDLPADERETLFAGGQPEIVTSIPVPVPSAKPKEVPQLLEMITPLFDHPLRDSALACSPEGIWYLTGTEASRAEDGTLDWSVNKGVRMWRSKDRKQWEDMGYVWTFEEDADKSPDKSWHQRAHLDLTCGYHQKIGRAITAPELHFIDGKAWIVYSLNGQGIGLMRSESGKAEGPYQDLGRIINRGRDGSLFADNGAVYLVWGEGFMAKLKSDFSGLDGPVKPLFCDVRWYPRQLRRMEILNQWGSSLTKVGKKYVWTFAARTGRFGINCIDACASWADSLDGPWGEPSLMINNGGQSLLVPDGDQGWLATVSGEDEYAQLPYLPAITPIQGSRGDLASNLGAFSPKANTSQYTAIQSTLATELDLWIGHPDLLPGTMRDIDMCYDKATDMYYCTGSPWAWQDYMDKVTLWQSKDMLQWEPLTGLFDNLLLKSETGVDGEKLESLLSGQTKDKRGNVVKLQWGEMKFFRVENEYYMSIQNFSGDITGGRGTYLIRSTTQRPQGPYEIVGPFPQADFYVDGKSVIVCGGDYLVSIPDFNAYCADFQPINLRNGMTITPERFVQFKEDCENGFEQMDGYYFNWSTDWNGNYDLNYTFSKKMDGPWSPHLRILPHGGNGKLFHDKQGKWWYAYFNNTNDVGTRNANYCRMNIYPVTHRVVNDELIVEPEALAASRERLAKLGMLWQKPAKHE